MRSQIGNWRHAWLATLVGLVAVGAVGPLSRANADPPDILRNYRFITNKSTVEVTGGFAGVEWPLNIAGRFSLVTGYKFVRGFEIASMYVPSAQFTDVKAILFDPRRATPLPSPGWDLDKTLNLTGLNGTFTVPDDLFFLGADGQGQAIRIEATLAGRLLHLTGASSDPLCCDFFNYKVDAWAHQLPWADFNTDGRVDGSDYTIWRQGFGSTVAAGTDGDANGDGLVDASDYTIWRDQFGQSDASFGGSAAVPEPGTIVLTLIALVTSAIAMTRRRHC